MGPGFRQDDAEESKAFLMRGSMDCFAALAMTRKERATFSASSPAKVGHPVRRGVPATPRLRRGSAVLARRSLGEGGKPGDDEWKGRRNELLRSQ